MSPFFWISQLIFWALQVSLALARGGGLIGVAAITLGWMVGVAFSVAVVPAARFWRGR